jgi:putative tryptophan/tyrosine transport system substrate-binding protein
MPFDRVKRREFISLLGGATAWPLAARAQQPAVPVVGFLNHGLPDERVRGLRQGLGEAGYIEGRNVAIEFRWANNEIGRLPELVSDLIHRRVAVIVAAMSTPAALASKAATTTIPIVFGVGTDPVADGLVASFNHPGSNLTGIAIRNWELGGKRVGLLHELSPGVAPFAVLLNPDVPAVAEPFIKDVQAAASAIGRRIEVFYARSNRDIDVAFASIVGKQASAVVIGPDVLLNNRRVQLVILASRHALPAIYPWREPVEIGGLMSYGSNFADAFRLVGIYAGRILKGEKAGDLPVQQPTKFELVINLQTARTLGIEIPATLLASADEVIE